MNRSLLVQLVPGHPPSGSNLPRWQDLVAGVEQGSLCRWLLICGKGRYFRSNTDGYEKVFGAVTLPPITGHTYTKFWSIKCSIEQAEEIRIPSSLEIVARSIPRSSDRSICKKSPTLCEMGRNANWHLSLREGSSTVMLGRPLMYFKVTTAIRVSERGDLKNNQFRFCFLTFLLSSSVRL